MKIVINACFGGFSISRKAAEYMAERGSELAAKELAKTGGGHWYGFGYVDESDGYDRSDPLLVEAVEVLGKQANGSMAELVVVSVPDGVAWHIEEYDGNEHVAENHRVWG